MKFAMTGSTDQTSGHPSIIESDVPTDPRHSANVVKSRLSNKLADKPVLGFTELMFASSELQAISLLTDDELADLVTSAHELVETKPDETHKIRVRSWSEAPVGSDGTVIEILNDDMPFLVGSIVGELRAHGVYIDLLLHPIITIEQSAGGGRTVSHDVTGIHNSYSKRESLVVVVARRLLRSKASEVEAGLAKVLTDVRHAVTDWQPMLKTFGSAVAALGHGATPADAETLEFCHWLLVGNFTFLGLRQYHLEGDIETGRLVPDRSSALGVLRDPDLKVLSKSGKELELTAESRQYVFGDQPLIITKSDILSRIHRRSYMDYIGLKTYDENGRQVGELRLVGLLTSNAYTERPSSIPLLRRKVDDVVQRMGISSGSHDGKALLNVLENFPRDELFRIDNSILVTWARPILDLDLRPRVRVFARRDRFDRFVSVLVYVPRENFSTGAREKIGDLLSSAFAGHVSAFTPFFPESPLIRVHYIIGRDQSEAATDVDLVALEDEITELTINWNDRLATAMDGGPGSLTGLKQKYRRAFSAAYSERFGVADALQDITRIERLSDERPVAIDFRGNREGSSRVNATVYRFDEPIPLSERVPVLENFGFRAIDERSYRITPEFDDGKRSIVLHDMELYVQDGSALDLTDEGLRLEAGYLAVRNGHAADDPFNQLIHAAKLDWREANLFRAYAAYLRQTGVPFGFRYLAETIVAYPELARDLIGLHRARFDPVTDLPIDYRIGLSEELEKRIEEALAKVPNLDEDRIIRHFLGLIQATIRSNYFQLDEEGQPRSVLAFKFDPQKISWLPAPKPYREIWVYSPRVEGVHLRFGPIARGGLRWSDRAQDFRTEVLGLCKAQQVKNTVIVPEGSKGGFYPKQLPRTSDRGVVVAEAVASYKIFISTMLQITDNVVDGKIIPPDRTVRFDGDDPYLVVAADKGTATFSDYANEISESYNFWLGDAFASGGSAGYDHKKMGITARGGWESVKRHFREMDHDIQTTPFAVAGVGDMSGDVFGNGMLLSPAIKLIAAFDHRDIFIDPDPDPESTFAERQRLFDLGQSSWQDYDKSKLSEGGGIFSRQAKEIKLSPQIRAVLDVEIETVTPLELLRLILKAKVDLLWFGGIGTYLKGVGETDDEVGDRANDAIRITAAEAGARVVGEGANLGVTQKGRIEFAKNGGRINTDFIDNSAGVNSSDKEVNIKIAVGGPMRDGRLTLEQRNELLASFTEDVAEACLWNNYQQSLAISLAEMRSAERLGYAGRLMRDLEQRGLLDRELEELPSDEALEVLQANGQGLTRPELAVLLSWSKIALAQDLLASDVPEQPVNETFVAQYFPETLRREYANYLSDHRLRREIIVTRISNDMINRCGPIMLIRLQDATGRSSADIASGFTAVLQIYGLPEIWSQIDALDNRIKGADQLHLYMRTQSFLIGQTIALLRREQGRDFSEVVQVQAAKVGEMASLMEACLTEPQRAHLVEVTKTLTDAGVGSELASKVAQFEFMGLVPAISRIASATGKETALIAKSVLGAQDFVGVSEVKARVQAERITYYYDQLAIYAAINQLETTGFQVAQKYVNAVPEQGGLPIADWIRENEQRISQFKSQLDEIVRGDEFSVSRLTVASHSLRDAVSS